VLILDIVLEQVGNGSNGTEFEVGSAERPGHVCGRD